MDFLFRGTIVRYYKLYFSFILKLYKLSARPRPTCAITKSPFPLFAINQHTNIDTPETIDIDLVSGMNNVNISMNAERNINPANTMYRV